MEAIRHLKTIYGKTNPQNLQKPTKEANNKLEKKKKIV